VAILLQPVADCNLRDYLLRSYSSIDRQRRKSVLYRLFGCLCITLKNIHKANIRHKDIKPVKILVYGSDVLFTDFGSETQLVNEEDMSRITTIGEETTMYASPELRDGEETDVISDVFSLGCVFLEVIIVLAGKRL
jgi:serine/threonine protein kinase